MKNLLKKIIDICGIKYTSFIYMKGLLKFKLFDFNFFYLILGDITKIKIKSKSKKCTILNLNKLKVLVNKKIENHHKNLTHLKFLIEKMETLKKIEFEELKEFSKILPLFVTSEQYVSILKACDSKLVTIEGSKSEFIGTGSGRGLNAYRKIEFKNKLLFEKIYLNNSRELEAIVYASSALPEKYIPKIIRVNEGENLTAVYSQYIDVKKPTLKETLEIIINITKELYRLEIHFDKHSKLDNILDKGMYLLGRQRALLEFNNNDFLSVENNVLNSKKMFTHGDMDPVNISKPSILLDYDSFGLFPMGFDFANFIARYYTFKNYNQLENMINVSFANTITSDDFESFKYNVKFFIIVMSYSYEKVDEKLNCEILRSLRNE